MRHFRAHRVMLTVLMIGCTGRVIADNTSQDVASGIVLLPGQLQPDRSPDGNSLIIHGKDGLIVVDTGRGNQHTQELVERVAASSQPLVGVINTHWHLDHIGGNASFRKRWPDVPIYAHLSLDVALDGFHADYRKQLETYLPTLSASSPEQKRYQAEMDLLLLDRQLAETNPVEKSTMLELGGRKLELHVSPHSVTEGDLWVFDRETRTLIAGDLVTLPVPMFDSACPEGWKQSLSEISNTDFKRLIPGHGQTLDLAEFSIYRKSFDRLLACSAKQMEACVDGWFADVKTLISPELEAYGRILLAYYIEQFIKPDAPGRKRWCAATN